MPTCTICGSAAFRPGFRGRTGKNGLGPTCAGCGSVERHRIVHAILKALRPRLAGMRALHFAPDASADPTWFRAYEPSTYGGPNSLDIMAIDRPDAAYDMALANHVIEHVPDDQAAFKELLRVVGPSGLVQVTLPSPLSRLGSIDWGVAEAFRNGHYRYYGGDCALRIKALVPETAILGIIGRDAVTGARHLVLFLARSPEALYAIGRDLVDEDLDLLRLA